MTTAERRPRATIPIEAHAVSVVVLGPAGEGWRVLLLRRVETMAGTWHQVAGQIEPGEAGWQAALREVREETGLVPDALYSADYAEQFYEWEPERIAFLPVFVAFVGEGASVTLNTEHDAYEWLAPADAMGRVPFAGQRAMLRHVIAEFVERPPNPMLRIEAAGPGRS